MAAKSTVPIGSDDGGAAEERMLFRRPGEVLAKEFMRPLGLTAYRVSKELGVAPITISEILRGLRAITPGMACRLGIFFGTHPVYWLALQATYDVHQKHSNKAASNGVMPCQHLDGQRLGPARAHECISLWQQCWTGMEADSPAAESLPEHAVAADPSGAAPSAASRPARGKGSKAKKMP